MLRGVLREQLLGDEVLVVSNREPFIHVRTDDGITLLRPASGLVTALEPVMRACSGTWIAHGSGSADRDTVDRARPRARASGKADLHAAPGLALAGRRAGLLRRIRQRGAVAAMSHRPRAAGISHRRLGAVRASQSALCRRGVRRGAHRRPGRPGPGLSLRAAAAHDPRAAARGDDHHVLAHPVAESGIVRHLPVARRADRGPARQHDSRLPHPLPLPEFCRNGRSLPRGEDRARIIDHLLRRRADAGRALSDLDPVAAGMGRIAIVGRAVPRQGAAGRAAARRRAARCRRRPHGLHQGHPRALPRRRAAARAASGVHRPLCAACRSPRRRAPRSRNTSISKPACARWRLGSMRDSAATATSRYTSRSSTTRRRSSTNTIAPPMCAWSRACTTA